MHIKKKKKILFDLYTQCILQCNKIPIWLHNELVHLNLKKKNGYKLLI